MAIGMEGAHAAEEATLVFPREIGAYAVEGDGDSATVRLKREELGHHLPGGAAHPAAEAVEILDPALVQHVPHDLQVHLGQVFPGQAALKILGERRVDEDELVELLHVRSDRQRRELVKHPQRVALLQELWGVLVVQAAADDENDVVDHVRYPAHLQELVQGPLGLALEVLELLDELRGAGLDERGRCVVALHLTPKRPVRRRSEVHLHVV
mmetsp:Transcript_10815/g.33045  ORF Transcript_10815/g.33045 Transcript_10815/m.33045 type:complete len:211 (+) Transcript_10815:356-988(+)